MKESRSKGVIPQCKVKTCAEGDKKEIENFVLCMQKRTKCLQLWQKVLFLRDALEK